MFTAALFLVLSTALVPLAHSNDSVQLDPLAGKVAKQIEKSIKKKNIDTLVLIVDFAQQSGQSSELGVKLADEFADSLRKAGTAFKVIDREDYRQAMAKEGITPEQATNPENWACLGFKLKADLIVQGSIKPAPNELALKIEVAQSNGPKRLFEGHAKLPLTSEMQALLSTSPAAPSKLPSPEQLVWVNPDHPPVPDEQIVSSQQLARSGDSYPQCASCPPVKFSEIPHTAKFNATVVLLTQIDTNGFPTKISVVRGAPCGLSAKAVETLSKWRFKPAMTSRGKPVAAEQMIEVSFHLY